MNNRIDRRRFIHGLAAAGTLAALPGALRAAMGPNDKFDLVIQGGEVLDPSQRLRAVRDVGIRNGVVEALEASIPAERAARVIDAKGRLVTPGLIDLHAHTYPYGSGIGIPADELVPHQGTTTAISAGDAGANNFAAFRRFIVASTRTRLYAFVHIANIGLTGFPIGELYNLDFARTEDAARTVAENADIVIGIKVRMSENVIAKHGLEPLRRAIRACELSGVAGAKVMCHIGGVENRKLMSDILDTLRPKDILTHCYWREGGTEFRDVNVMAVAHGTEKEMVLAHKRAIDEHLVSIGIPVAYTNVFWGGRSEIKPSEISPIAYREWCVSMGIDPESMRG